MKDEGGTSDEEKVERKKEKVVTYRYKRKIS
jgi:hypothetical protein